MINMKDIMETITMIQDEHLDIRTITMGISLIDCCDSDIDKSCQKVYDKIYRLTKDLVKTGEDIEKKYGIPIVNKRISVTPISYVGAGLSPDGFVRLAKALDRAAKELGITTVPCIVIDISDVKSAEISRRSRIMKWRNTVCAVRIFPACIICILPIP